MLTVKRGQFPETDDGAVSDSGDGVNLEAGHRSISREGARNLKDWKAVGEAKLTEVLQECRIQAEVVCIPVRKDVDGAQYSIVGIPGCSSFVDSSDAGGASEDTDNISIGLLNHCAKNVSNDAGLLFMTLPQLPNNSSPAGDRQYLSRLRKLTAGLPPIALTANGQGIGVITTEI
jgi:hypothetical protein